MQDKIKYIIFGLAAFVILIVLMFLGLKVKSLERERQDLQNQNSELNQKVEVMTRAAETMKKEIAAAQKAFEDTTAQLTDTKKTLETVVQERDALSKQVAEIVSDKEKAAKEKPEPAVKPQVSLDDAYFAGILKQKADLEVQISMMRDNFKALKAANDQLVLEKNNLVFEVNNLNRDAQDVQQASAYNQKMVDNLTQELAREKTDKLELAKRLKTLKTDNRQLRQQLQSLGERRLSLEKKLADMQSKNAALESSLAGMELYVKQQMFQMGDIKNQMEDARGAARSAPAARAQSARQTEGRREAIQLPPIVVRPQQDSAGQGAGLSGAMKIISVDEDNNFVVINAGQESNVKIGDTFQVTRDGDNVGIIKVIQVRERIAACDIKDEKMPLRVGDLVR